MISLNKNKYTDYLQGIIDIREYDVPYHSRVCIDLNIRCSYWYNISFSTPYIKGIIPIKEMTDRPDLRVLAFDIETTKLPLKFPDAKIDNVMMISLMVEGTTNKILIKNKIKF